MLRISPLFLIYKHNNSQQLTNSQIVIFHVSLYYIIMVV